MKLIGCNDDLFKSDDGGLGDGAGIGCGIRAGDRFTNEQADCASGTGESAAVEQFADVDGGVAGCAVCRDGECGLWDVRVELHAVAGGAGYEDGNSGGFSRGEYERAREADTVFRARLQPGWQAYLREYGVGGRSAGDGERRYGQRGGGVRIRWGEDCQTADDQDSAAAVGGGSEDDADRREGGG